MSTETTKKEQSLFNYSYIGYVWQNIYDIVLSLQNEKEKSSKSSIILHVCCSEIPMFKLIESQHEARKI